MNHDNAMIRHATRAITVLALGWVAGTHAEAASMCASGDTPVLSCRLARGGKTASICVHMASASASTYFYYAYGKRGTPPEMIYPKAGAKDTLSRTHLMFGGNTGGYAFGFNNGGYRYAMYSVTGTEGMQKGGLVVTRDGRDKPVMDDDCTAGSITETDDTDLIRASSTLPDDPSVHRHLPIH
ncbi:hypothetical protein P3W24_03480 [Luteibacter sp. PPL201]|uniref:Uncharacterized protein n=1 Tax=Luteibacter sahnii TaxID=3021977 RepID=A0ABT6B7H3_9GAMM|nr:hypothetical protein [Luteibacter sp. PPL193]MDY1548014.1 hypothetical protein [Luteibacter sp. PPL193]